MSIQEMLTYLGVTPKDGIIFAIFVVSGLIEISKININPWSAIGRGIRNILLKDVDQSISKIQNDLSEHIAQSHRQAIIDFTTECMNGQEHTKEQFNYIFKSYRKYEQYVKENHLTNDEVNESIAYIRRIYQKNLDEGNFEG